MLHTLADAQFFGVKKGPRKSGPGRSSAAGISVPATLCRALWSDSNSFFARGIFAREHRWTSGSGSRPCDNAMHTFGCSEVLPAPRGIHPPFNSCQNRAINIGPRTDRLSPDRQTLRCFTQQYEVLFVVLLLAVIQALSSGCQSRASGGVQALLPCAGPSRPFASNRTEAQPGRHDFVRI